MSVQSRNKVQISGPGHATMVFAHGFGCDQSMWRFLAPACQARFRTVLFDLSGCGDSDRAAYERTRHGSLHGHADDLLEILEACYINDGDDVGGFNRDDMEALLASMDEDFQNWSTPSCATTRAWPAISRAPCAEADQASPT